MWEAVTIPENGRTGQLQISMQFIFPIISSFQLALFCLDVFQGAQINVYFEGPIIIATIATGMSILVALGTVTKCNTLEPPLEAASGWLYAAVGSGNLLPQVRKTTQGTEACRGEEEMPEVVRWVNQKGMDSVAAALSKSKPGA